MIRVRVHQWTRLCSCWLTLQGSVAYIRSLPINDTPDIFGLHDNANITFAQNETNLLLTGLVNLQPKTTGGGGKSQEEVICFIELFFIIGWLLEISEVHFRTNKHMSSLQTSMEGCDSCCSCKSFIVLSSRWPLSCLPQCSFRWSITRVSKEHVTFTKGVHIKLHRTEDIGLTGL